MDNYDSHRRILLICGAVLLASATVVTGSFVLITIRRIAGLAEFEATATVDRRWEGMKGYLRIEKESRNSPAILKWYYDPEDPGQSYAVSQIRERFLLADERGVVLARSQRADALYADPSRIRKLTAQGSPAGLERPVAIRDSRGRKFLVRDGIVFDANRLSPYYVAIAAPLNERADRVRWLTPLMAALAGCAFATGWCIAVLFADRRRFPA